MNKLSVETSRLISSLQVITKVESVVKELVENAFDAGATSIDVKFENYGLSRIEVRDNGSGIKQDNVEYAAQRHYTSKISNTEDLKSISSYGFRGEALSSLCQVAEVFITTRTKTDCFSSKYSFNDKGIVTAVKPSHLGKGTTVVACNLFSKMPVRCQFYQTEAKKKQIIKNTEDLLIGFALIHPKTKICLHHNKCLIWQTPSCKDTLTTLQNIMGTQITSQLKQFDYYCSQNNIHIWALIPTTAPTRCFRKSSDRFFIFVNERPVRDKEIEQVVKQQTSHPTSNQLKWPLVVLRIKLPIHNVDANVETDKSRVMIVDKKVLLDAIEEMFSQAYQSLSKEIETNKENMHRLTEANPESIENEPDLPSGDNPMNPHKSNESCVIDVPVIARPKNQPDENVTESTPQSGDCRQQPFQEIQSNHESCHTSHNSGQNTTTSGPDGRVTALKWSKGQCDKISNAADIQPVKILVGNHGKPNLASLESDPDDAILLEQVHILENDNSSSGWEFLTQKGSHSTSSNRPSNSRLESTPLMHNKTESSDNLSSMEQSVSDIFGEMNGANRNDRAGCESGIQKAPRPNPNMSNSARKRPSFGNLRDIFSPVRSFDNSTTSKESPRVSRVNKAKKRSIGNTPITKWTFDTSPNTTISSSETHKIGPKSIQYHPGQEREMTFDFGLIRKHLFLKPPHTSENNTEFSTIGVLKDVKGGILLHHKNQEICLINLLRLQEMKIFHSLMGNHCFPRKKLNDPVVIYTTMMQSDESNGLKNAQKLSLDSASEGFEIVDYRIVKNGFKIFMSTDSIRVSEMTNIVPYLNIDDLKWILRKIGQTHDISLNDCRPYKTAQYLQSEAVRISTSTPIHPADLEIPPNLTDRSNGSMFDARCFHGKPLLHSIHCLVTK